MRILFLGNNWIGWQVVKWLKEQNEEIVGLVIHPTEKQKYRDEIIESSKVKEGNIFYSSQLSQLDTQDAIKSLEPDIGLSILFGYILKPNFINLFPSGVINLHPAYLPFNRGAYPNVWSIVEGTPAGVTLHYIDAKIDTGDIIAQRRVQIESVDTGKTLNHKLENASVELFKETWLTISSGQTTRIPQREDDGTYHSTQDVRLIDCIDLDREYTAKELFDIIRARTYPPYAGAYFIDVEGRKVYLRLELFYENQIGE